MAGLEQFNSFYGKFLSLWRAGLDASLHVNTHGGDAEVHLRVGLGQAPPHQNQQPRQPRPSRIRRSEKRAEERRVAVEAAARQEANEAPFNKAAEEAVPRNKDEEATSRQAAEEVATRKATEDEEAIARQATEEVTARKAAEEANARKAAVEATANKAAEDASNVNSEVNDEFCSDSSFHEPVVETEEVDEYELARNKNVKKVIVYAVTKPIEKKIEVEQEIREKFAAIGVKVKAMQTKTDGRGLYDKSLLEISEVNLNRIWGRRLGLNNCSVIAYEE